MVSEPEQVWALLGVAATVRRSDEIVALAQHHPPVRQWIVDHPHRALELAPKLPRLITAYRWLDSNRGSQRYLREISAPGVDTKFAEGHRLGEGVRLEQERIDWERVQGRLMAGCAEGQHQIRRFDASKLPEASPPGGSGTATQTTHGAINVMAPSTTDPMPNATTVNPIT